MSKKFSLGADWASVIIAGVAVLLAATHLLPTIGW
ncbi:hypothetical protein BC739_004801 [Kutzneria viridogrisea]|uniref:Uncharacterized protein n=2 Tax=Kutzneria TaxID=43356 RepID=A0ABR6BL13_9PSEU|nr:putative secreted protein [Kutzneria albida DSM 43870]MBA8927595.1 hypothetical protein [Kutzneria viridogrisea]